MHKSTSPLSFKNGARTFGWLLFIWIFWWVLHILAEDDYSGILAGYALNNDSDNKSIVFKNITVSGSIDTSSISGGMIGGLDKCSVEGCETNISIKNGYNNGGIIGISSEKCIFNNCVSIGSIEGNWCLGGFVGYNDGGKIKNCLSKVNVESTVTTFEHKEGGFVGKHGIGNIASSHVTSSHDAIKAGGFSGEGSDGITDSSFNKDVNPALKCAGGDAPADIVVDALTASILAQEKGVVLVNEKSDNSILEGKDIVQIGGFDFEI